MAIKLTYPANDYSRPNEVEVIHTGLVKEVRTYGAMRNMSDTMDYTDFCSVTVTEALVYRGRMSTPRSYDLDQTPKPLPVEKRFEWVDCSNHFTWRGSPHMEATVDASEGDHEMSVDYLSFKDHHAAIAKAAADKKTAWEKAEKARKAKEELNRPIVGKRMIVVKGRKVPVGHTGTVAYISGSSVLLKAHHEYKNRKATGVWVDSSHLENDVVESLSDEAAKRWVRQGIISVRTQ